MTSPPRPAQDPLPPTGDQHGDEVLSLDTLHFQDVVDDAKRLIPSLYPQWTDHNVSDPGITMVEACAALIDELSYRLDRLPAEVRDAYLRLIAPPRRAATAARAMLTFTHAPGASVAVPLIIAENTQVTSGTDGPVFTTQEKAYLPPIPGYAYGKPAGKPGEDGQPPSIPFPVKGQTYEPTVLETDAVLTVGAAETSPGSAPTDMERHSILLLLADPGPGKLVTVNVRLRSDARLPSGAQAPQAVWQALTARGWQPVALLNNGTGGQLLAAGAQYTFASPADAAPVTVKTTTGRKGKLASFAATGCLALRMSVQGLPPAAQWQVVSLHPSYAVSPPVPAVQVEKAVDMGPWTATGKPGQTLRLPGFPFAGGLDSTSVTVTVPGRVPQTWTRADTFATAGAETPAYVLDLAASTVAFGPLVGTRQCGRIPEAGAAITVKADITAGRRGNVPADSLTRLSTPPSPVPQAILRDKEHFYAISGALVATVSANPGGATVSTEPWAQKWPALKAFTTIDAAVGLPRAGSDSGYDLVFFSDKSYVSIPAENPGATSTPAPISAHPGLPPGGAEQNFTRDIDAALWDDKRGLFLFKGPHCINRPLGQKPADRSCLIAELIRGLPEPFTQGIDAASMELDGQWRLFSGVYYVAVRDLVCTTPAPLSSVSLWPKLQDHIPAVSVTNTAPALGGTDPESFEDLLRDTAAGFREPHRSITSEDYAHVLSENLPGVARAVCVPSPEHARYDLLIILLPLLPPGTPPSARSLHASEGLLRTARERLEALRLLGTRICVTGPVCVPVRISLEFNTNIPAAGYPALRDHIREALTAFLHPATGGSAGTGWPLGHTPTPGEISAVMATIPAVRTTGQPGVELLHEADSETPTATLPYLDLLDLIVNGQPMRDSDIVDPSHRTSPTTTRSLSLTLALPKTYTWDVVQGNLSGGRWQGLPPTLGEPKQTLVCAATTRDDPFTGQLSFRLHGTNETVTLEWSNPPSGDNTYALTTTANIEAAVLAGDGKTAVTVAGGQSQRFTGHNVQGDTSSAHALLPLALTVSSKLLQVLTITAKDGSNDAWEASFKEDQQNCKVAQGTPLTVTVTSTTFTTGMAGTVTFKNTKARTSDRTVTVGWSTDAKGTVSFTAKGPVKAFLDDGSLHGLPLTETPTPRPSESPGGGLVAQAALTLKDPDHRTVTVHLDNRLPATLALRKQDLRNSVWTIAPTAIPQGVAEFAAAATDQGTEASGTVSYSYALDEHTVGDIVLSWKSPPQVNAKPLITLTLPPGAEIAYDQNLWQKGN